MRMRKRKRRVIRLHGREMWEEKKTKRITALGERGARTGGTRGRMGWEGEQTRCETKTHFFSFTSFLLLQVFHICF